jgi:7-cyano-7-deazaguanine synthase
MRIDNLSFGSSQWDMIRSMAGEKALVLLSGGLDSAVSLYWAQAEGWDLATIEFEYHLRPARERKSCSDLRRRTGVETHVSVPIPFIREGVDLPPEAIRNPFLLGAPEGYVPSRNLIFYSLCAYHAEILGARYIVGGHNRTDPESFPDAGRGFFERLNALLGLSVWSYASSPVEIVLPLLEMDKIGVLRLGQELGVPFDLTWSCYTDQDQPCGTCESCLERERAFAQLTIDG